MPNAPIIKIPIDDSAFDKFTEKFSAYCAKLDEMPEAWQKLGEAMGASAQELETGAGGAKNALAIAAAQAGIVSEALADAVKAQKDLGDQTDRSAGSMGKLRKHAEGLGGAIKSIGGWIIKLGALGGLGGLLSGLGIADLAGAAFNRSRSAGRLGISTGLLASYGVNAQQFLGSGALEGAVNAQADSQKWGALGVVSGNLDKALNQNPVALAFDLERKAYQAYLEDKKNGMKNFMQDQTIGLWQSVLGGNVGDLRNIERNGGLRAFNAAEQATYRDAPSLEIKRKEQDAWNKLYIKMGLAGDQIQTVFISGLTPLTPELANLTTEFKGFVTEVLQSQNAKDAINYLTAGLHSLGDTLASKDFANNLKIVVNAIGWAADKLAWVPKGAWMLGTGIGTLIQGATDENAPMYAADPVGKGLQFLSGSGKDAAQAYGQGGSVVQKIIAQAKKMGVDAKLAVITAFHESGLNPKSVGDKGHSHGLFQLNDAGEGAGLTLAQMNDPTFNTARALAQFVYNKKRGEKYTENIFSKAVRVAAAYGKGPNATHAQIAALFGTKGMESAAAQRPADPYDYAVQINEAYRASNKAKHEADKKTNRPIKARAPKAQVSLTIYNSTSSRTIVGVNAAALA